MDRITSRTLSGQAIVPIPRPKGNYAGPWPNPYEPAVDRLAAIEDILGDTYDLDHLRELLTAERGGRVHKQPCKLGDTVYLIIHGKKGYRLEEGIAKEMHVYEDGTFITAELETGYKEFDINKLGQGVFLNREEAEAALAKMKEG